MSGFKSQILSILSIRVNSLSLIEQGDGLAGALRGVGLFFEGGEAVDDAAEVFDALDEVVEAYVLVGRVWVGAEVADAEGDDGHRRLVRAADGADGAARGVERVDERLAAVQLARALDGRARHHRRGRGLRVRGRAQLDDLHVLKAALVEVLAQKLHDQSRREVGYEAEVEARGGRARQ